MPECGHMNGLKALDQKNCQGFYHLDSYGTIVGVNSGTRAHVLHEPKCRCGQSCPSVGRYSAVLKMTSLSKTLDLLLAKMGKKMSRFSKSIEFFQKALPDSLEIFLSGIRPNPLAALSNTRQLLQRQRDIVDLHKDIVNYRNDVIAPIEESFQNLHLAIPQRVHPYTMLFQSRFEILEYRAMSLRISDDLQLANRMVKLADPSQGVQRQGYKMMQFVCRQSIACMAYCQEALSRGRVSSAPPLEAELRLQQAQFLIFAKDASLRLSRLGPGTISFTPPISAQDIIDSLKLILSEDALDFAGRKAFAKTLRAFQDHFSSMEVSETVDIPMICNESSREIEKSWSHHESGALTTCSSSHVYSRKTFPRGCPDCGNLAPATPEITETARPLREADFLKAMHKLHLGTSQPTLDGGDGRSESTGVESIAATDSPFLDSGPLVEASDNGHALEKEQEVAAMEWVFVNERETKDLENREKFLTAMRKLGT